MHSQNDKSGPLTGHPPAGAYIPAIDGLRAVAALSVIAFHAGLVPFGWAGVWMFYVISGFVITRGVVLRRWQLSRQSYAQFFMARVRRIWPLYFLYIVVAEVALIALEGHPPGFWTLPTKDEILSLATFTGNFHQMLSYLGDRLPETRATDHLWTISVEQQFYLVFPLLFEISRRAKPAKILGCVIAIAVIIRIIFVYELLHSEVPPETTSSMLYFFSPGHFDAFAAGMLLAFYADQIGLARKRYRIYAGAALVMAVFLSGILLGPDMQAVADGRSYSAFAAALRPYLGSHPTQPAAMVAIYTVVVAISAALMAAALSPASRIGAALGWGPLVWIGQISYGVYIWHRLPGGIAEAIIGGPETNPPWMLRLVALGLTTAVTLGLAFVSYHAFERRFHRRIGT